jgi:hypothetical protein
MRRREGGGLHQLIAALELAVARVLDRHDLRPKGNGLDTLIDSRVRVDSGVEVIE